MLGAGHEVPTAILASQNVMDLEVVIAPEEVFHRDIAWIDNCDTVIAEVSTPSHGVGYEIAYALGIGKPVLCCYQSGRRVSKMITGNNSPGLTLLCYSTPQEAENQVAAYLDRISSNNEKSHQ